MSGPDTDPQPVELKRAVTLVPLVLYGLGITIGAGIYVLVGETAARAGVYAPSSFLLAAFVMAFSAGSFAELSGRIPQAAGEAAYVQAGFHLRWLTLAVGLSIILTATVAGAAISLGCAGYLGQILPLPDSLLIVFIISAMGLLAFWGIKESVGFAAVLTVLEVGGLLAIIAAGLWADPGMLRMVSDTIPSPVDGSAIAGILSASVIAYFAFIGFDDVVNLVEEAVDPARMMPWAIGISLVIVTVIYWLVTMVALNTLPLSELAASRAPVGLLFERLTGFSPLVITLIAIFATMNGVVIQVIMAARVAYGLSSKGHLPRFLSRVHPTTRTPYIATGLITVVMLGFALMVELDQLAQWTSQIILGVFALVNLALFRIKLRGDPMPENGFRVPVLVPLFGTLTCLALLFAPLLIG